MRVEASVATLVTSQIRSFTERRLHDFFANSHFKHNKSLYFSYHYTCPYTTRHGTIFSDPFNFPREDIWPSKIVVNFDGKD
jgi:hypothetical protein